MAFIYAALGLIVGLLLGIFVTRLMTPEYKKHKQLQKQVDHSKFELEQHRQELADHFSKSAEMLDTLGKNYTKLYQHMAHSSNELLPEHSKKKNPFEQASIETKPKQEKIVEPEPETQPKDYAQGEKGLLKEETKVSLQHPNEEPKVS